MNLSGKLNDAADRARGLKPGERLVGQAGRAEVRTVEERQQELFDHMDRTVDGLRAGLQETMRGTAITASRTFPVRQDQTLQRILSAQGRFLGWSLYANVNSFTVVRFRLGWDATGEVVAVVALQPFTSASMRIGGNGGVFIGPEGLSMTVDGGTIEGAIHLGSVD